MLVAAVLVALVPWTSSAAERPATKPVCQKNFDELLVQYEDLTYEQLVAGRPRRSFRERLSFDPARAAYFDRVREALQLTDQELAILNRNGFVSVDHDQRYSFGSMYHAIYTRDLPVLVTTDSILNALHRSFEEIVVQLETCVFAESIDEVLSAVHDRVGQQAPGVRNHELAIAYEDVDLYLTVARNLLAAKGKVRSNLGQDAEAGAILERIESGQVQLPPGEPTQMYGGTRYVDYSQFMPRGHYTRNEALQRYFRTLMWLGRADCGFNVLRPDLRSGLEIDSLRETRAAALLATLLHETGSLNRLDAMRSVIDLLMGRSDNLTLLDMIGLLDEAGLHDVDDLAEDKHIIALQEAIASSGLATQHIRAQIILSDSRDPSKVPPPSQLQLFGQCFAIDSFVLSQVVFDSIIFDGQKVQRHMPSGLDVMAALGNDEAIPLLADELRQWPYAANLKASIDFVNARDEAYWQSSLYTIWLDCLRLLDDQPSADGRVPQAMQTQAWQMKQLQTQLASWSQLRHDTVLYAKQAYTSGDTCDYPADYVEPYPEFYASIRRFAESAGRHLERVEYPAGWRSLQRQFVGFMAKMAGSMATLEVIAGKELDDSPLTRAEVEFLKNTITNPHNQCGVEDPVYDGWYAELYYPAGIYAGQWRPTVADVHTNPNRASAGDPPTVLETAVGDVTFLVIAVDTGDEPIVYVGPVFTYFEFEQPAVDRLTDEKWQQMITEGRLPQRPTWTAAFASPAQKRHPGPMSFDRRR